MWGKGRSLGVRKRILVNLDNGSAFQGILWKRTGELLELKDATYLEPGQKPVRVDGEVLIERSKVDWMQVQPWNGGT